MFDLFKKAEGDYVPGVQGMRGKGEVRPKR